MFQPIQTLQVQLNKPTFCIIHSQNFTLFSILFYAFPLFQFKIYNYNCTIPILQLQTTFYNCTNCHQLHVKKYALPLSKILLYNFAIWLTVRRSTLLYRAARAAGLATSPAASDSGRESERGRLNKSKEPQTGSGSITTIYYKRGALGAAGRGQPIEEGVNARKGGGLTFRMN